jgi:hypothetical protein
VKSRRTLALAVHVAAAALLAPASARADHSEEERIIDQTAYTLPKGNFQLGLFRQEWGPIDRLTVGTYALPWLLRFANAHLKWKIIGNDPVSIAASIGVFRFAPQQLKESSGDAVLTIVPFDLVGSWRIDDRWTLSPGFVYTVVTLKGSYDPAQLEGVAAVSNLQFVTTLEYRLTTKTAFVLHGRYLVFQNTNGRVTTTLHPDKFTTVELQAVASTDALDFPFAFSVVPSVVFSWKVFNLRLGLGYGNCSLPAINLVLPKKTVVPDLDFYFRF